MGFNIDINKFTLPVMAVMLLIAAIIAVILSLFLIYHWKNYSFGQPAVPVLRILYFSGLIALFILMIMGIMGA